MGCSKGFELIDLSNLNTQDLLDFSDPTLDFVHKKDENLKPLAIYRIGSGDSFTFLLCYEGIVSRFGHHIICLAY